MNDSLELVIWSIVCSTLIVACVYIVARCFMLLLEDLMARRKDRECDWNGEGFRSAEVADRVREVRGNYIPAHGEKSQLQRKERVSNARRLVSDRSYFRHFEEAGLEQQPH